MSSQWSGAPCPLFWPLTEREEAVEFEEDNRSINLNLLKIFIKPERERAPKNVSKFSAFNCFQGWIGSSGGERDLHSNPVSPRLLTDRTIGKSIAALSLWLFSLAI